MQTVSICINNSYTLGTNFFNNIHYIEVLKLINYFLIQNIFSQTQSRLISHPICLIFFRVFHSIILAHLLAVPSLPPSTLSSLAGCRYPSMQLLALGFVDIPLIQILEVGSLLDLVYSVLVHSRYYPTSVCLPSFWRVPVCLLMCFLRFGL